MPAFTAAKTLELGDYIPVAGTFEHFASNDPEKPVVRGAVHAVQRIPGGTALYYSIGMPPGAGADYRGHDSFKSLPGPYGNTAANVALVDVADQSLYRPMVTDDEIFASDFYDLKSFEGELRVAYAVFPELDEGTEYVDVILPYHAHVISVKVGEGALVPAAENEMPPLLGGGWPQLPSEAEIRKAKPEDFTWRVRHSFEDHEGTAEIEEIASEVHVTLDANVVFAVDKWNISEKAEKRLGQVADDINERGTGEVLVVGHTDSRGGTAHNQKLSERRAASVEKHLRNLVTTAGITFKAVGKGETEPIASNSEDEGRAKNRRVEITYQVQEEK